MDKKLSEAENLGTAQVIYFNGKPYIKYHDAELLYNEVESLEKKLEDRKGELHIKEKKISRIIADNYTLHDSYDQTKQINGHLESDIKRVKDGIPTDEQINNNDNSVGYHEDWKTGAIWMRDRIEELLF